MLNFYKRDYSSKHFIECANDIIRVAKGYPNNARLINNLIRAKCEEFSKVNPFFDEQRFREYIKQGGK